MNKKKVRKHSSAGKQKQYMIDLHKWRSRTALSACIITLVCTLYALAGGLLQFAKTDQTREMFHYFTTNSNILTAFAAGTIIPFAIEGIRRKRFTYPKWAAMLHYAGTICTTLTMVFALCFISWVNPELAFGGYNTFLHIICPAMVLISFFLVESDFRYSRKDMFICLTPYYIYAAIYLYEVVFLGPAKGGWEDLYMLATFVSPLVSFPLMTLLVIAVAAGIRKVYNKLGDIRLKRMTDQWSEDLEPVEIKIEVFGLGRYMGSHEDEYYALLPLDILDKLGQRYNIKEEELMQAYVKGVLQAHEEKKQQKTG